jgi:hypothetical protein
MGIGTVNFSTLPGIATGEQTISAKWLVTGVSGGIDLGRMSVAPDRRDFGPGISGRQAAAEADTCFLELDVNPKSPPPFSYLVTFTGRVQAVDLRSAGDAAFSGAYYGRDVTPSQDIIEHNRAFLESGNFNAVIRYSAAAQHKRNTLEVVYAFLPSVTGVLEIQNIEPLGDNSPPVPIRWPNGKAENTKDYYRS